MTEYTKQLEESNATLEQTIRYLEKRTMTWKNSEEFTDQLHRIESEFLHDVLYRYCNDSVFENKEIKIIQVLAINKKIISSVVKYKNYYMSIELKGAKFTLDRLSDIKKAVEETILFEKTDIVADEPSKEIEQPTYSNIVYTGSSINSGISIANGNTGTYVTVPSYQNNTWTLSNGNSRTYIGPGVNVVQCYSSSIGKQS